MRNKYIVAIISIIAFALLFFYFLPKKSEKIDIVVSIKPIHSLVCALTKGIAEPSLLLDGTISPHHAYLQPTQAQKLKKAKVVIWIGPAYEQMLAKHLKGLESDILTLQKGQKIPFKLLRNGALWDQHSCCNHEHHDHHDHHHHDHAHSTQETGIDGHIWLSPMIMIQAVDVVLEFLKKSYPYHHELLNKNAHDYKSRLQLLHQQLLQKMKLYKGCTYIIQHDGTQYFDELYGVKAIATLSIDPSIPPSAGHILKIRKAIQEGIIHPKCLYAERQINADLAKTYADSLKISFLVVDYLGVDIQAGEKAYEELMHAYVDEFTKSLK